MKKSLMFAAILAAGFMASCSNEDKSFEGANNDADRQPILFTMNNGAVKVTTRGTGAVGDIAGSTNVWRSEKIYVSMFYQNTLEYTEDQMEETGIIFQNEELTAPASTAASNSGVAEYAGYKYYPQQNNHDFFAYHISDAADKDALNELVNIQEKVATLDVEIDGSQDLMVAKADMTAEQRVDWTTKLADENNADKADRYYSAFSARRGVQPHFQFEHLLSRFVFNVIPTPSSKDLVTIESIAVTNAKTNATMVVAYTEKPEQLLIPADENEANTVYLKESKAGETEANILQTLTPKTYSEKTRVGESLLLMPQNEYDLVITMSQVTPEGKTYTFPYTYKMTPEKSQVDAFKAGNQYNVNFTVYGIEEIKIDVTLTPWVIGGDINIDNDEEDEN